MSFLFLLPPGMDWKSPCSPSCACLSPPQSSGLVAWLAFLNILSLLFSEDFYSLCPAAQRSFFRRLNWFPLPTTRHFCLKFKVIHNVPLCAHLRSSQAGSGILTPRVCSHCSSCYRPDSFCLCCVLWLDGVSLSSVFLGTWLGHFQNLSNLETALCLCVQDHALHRVLLWGNTGIHPCAARMSRLSRGVLVWSCVGSLLFPCAQSRAWQLSG